MLVCIFLNLCLLLLSPKSDPLETSHLESVQLHPTCSSMDHSGIKYNFTEALIDFLKSDHPDEIYDSLSNPNHYTCFSKLVFKICTSN